MVLRGSTGDNMHQPKRYSLPVNLRGIEGISQHGITIESFLETFWAILKFVYTGDETSQFSRYTINTTNAQRPSESSRSSRASKKYQISREMSASEVSKTGSRIDGLVDTLPDCWGDQTAPRPHQLIAHAALVLMSSKQMAESSHMSLECEVQEDIVLAVKICKDSLQAALYFSDVGSVINILHLVVDTIEQTFYSILWHWTSKIESLDVLSTSNSACIFQGVGAPAVVADACLGDILAQQVNLTPYNLAVDAWDGSLTYAQLYDSSTQLAAALIGEGVSLEERIPFCMQKSKWAIVAMFGILLAGATCVPLDIRSPKSRVETLVNRISAKHAVGDRSTVHLFEGLALHAFDCSQEPSRRWNRRLKLPNVSPSSAAFISFTSGSTGAPKGVVQEHGPLYTKILEFSKACTIDSHSRVFQFATYVSDASVGDIFGTLIQGGCVCIPSEEQRMEELSDICNQLNVTHACLTNTVIARIHPERLHTLRYLFAGGEALKKPQLLRWLNHVNFNTIYGTTESLLWDSLTTSSELMNEYNSLGQSFGPCFWLVDAGDPERLQPVGAVGEILIEGPLLARGYINDLVTTSAKFIDGPSWLRDFRKDNRVRCYRTGDKAFRNLNGTLNFLGRTDTQIKLRGQRIEPGEIEHYIKAEEPSFEQVVVQALSVSDRREAETLVAFFCLAHCSDTIYTDSPLLPLTAESRAMVDRVRRDLSAFLPQYMVPSLFLPVRSMPLTVLGKLDRNTLRQWGSSLKARHMAHYLQSALSTFTMPESEDEKLLQRLWAGTLQLPEAIIGLGDNFWQLGGDSIKAMELAATLRDYGFILTVPNISAYPTLLEMASVLQKHRNKAEDDSPIRPLGLLPRNLDTVRCVRDAAQICQVNGDLIEDVFPTTPMQEALMAVSAHRTSAYRCQMAFKLPSKFDLDHFRSAWQALVIEQPIFRTRIVMMPNIGSLQVVLRPSNIEWLSHTSLKKYLASDMVTPMEYGGELLRLALIEDQETTYFVWTGHHAIYDGWSQSLMYEEIQSFYQHGTIKKAEPYNRYIRYQVGLDPAESDDFWREQFSSYAEIYPKLHSSGYTPQPRQTRSSAVKYTQGLKSTVTTATVIQAAWALVVAKQASTEDPVFGLALAGRDAPVVGITKMMGPTVTTVPVKISVKGNESLESFLGAVQDRVTQIKRHQHTGIQRIRHLSPEARSAASFQNLLVIHPQHKYLQTLSHQFDIELLVSSTIEALDYALIVQCTIDSEAQALRFMIQFDARVITNGYAESLLHQISHMTSQLFEMPLDTPLDDLNTTPIYDIRQYLSWNATEIETIATTIHGLVEMQVQQRPEAIALSSFEGDFTYAQLDAMAETLVPSLYGLGIGPEVRVVLCFYKSIWPIVAMLAVLKSSGVCVSVNPDHPSSRLLEICDDVGATTLLCDESSEARFSPIVRHVMSVNAWRLQEIRLWHASNGLLSTKARQDALPSNAAFVVYTSGSTGKPKGSVLEHQSLCTSLTLNGRRTSMGPDTRALQFSAYTFDAHILEIFGTLSAGGCVCVISDDERMNQLADAINARQATWALLTPTVLRLLSPKAVPNLQTLIISGEPLAEQDVRNWAGSVRCFNGLGPSECSILACIGDPLTPESDPANIGFPIGCHIWISDYNRPDRLVPLGCVGEMIIEGPIVGRGYVNRPEATATSFFAGLPWASSVSAKSKRTYRTGDLAKFNSDGSVNFIGRADNQVKMHGQRVELGEIEHYLIRAQPRFASVAAELVDMRCQDNDRILAVFVSFCNRTEKCNTPSQPFLPLDDAMRQDFSEARQKLSQQLPSYMVPALYLPVYRMPQSPSAKLERKTLRYWFQNIDSEQLAQYFVNEKRVQRLPATQEELVLQALWAKVLGNPRVEFDSEDHFFEVGGDSVRAMRLTATLREQGYHLGVSQILKHPRLHEMARLLVPASPTEQQTQLKPFDLISQSPDVHKCIDEAARACNIEKHLVEDIYPATPMQEALMAISAYKERAYHHQAIFKTSKSPDFDIARFCAAWEIFVRAQVIFRTRIAMLAGVGTVQVVLKPQSLKWHIDSSLDGCLDIDQKSLMSYGTELARFALAKDNDSQISFFVLTVHHAIYDGWSLPLVFDEVTKIYKTSALMPLNAMPYNTFVQWLCNMRIEDAEDFWLAQFPVMTQSYPQLPPHHVPQPQHTKCYTINLPPNRRQHVTLAAMIHAAWAIVTSMQAGTSEEALFAVTLSGRDVPVAGITRNIGPTMTTVPIRTEIDLSQTVDVFLKNSQELGGRIREFQHLGLQRIRRLSLEAQAAADCQNLLVVHASNDPSSSLESIGLVSVPHAQKEFLDRALTVDCTIKADIIEVSAQYDDLVVPSEQMEHLLHQFEHMLSALAMHTQDQRLSDIDLLSAYDFQRLVSFNSKPLDSVPATLHELVEAQVHLRPEAVAISGPGGDYTYRRLDNLAAALAARLNQLGISHEKKVILCFAKSEWPIIAMYAVLKAGGVCVSVSKDHPTDRLVEVCADTEASVVLCDVGISAKFAGFMPHTLAVNSDLLSDAGNEKLQWVSPLVLPSDAAFVVYTSGSTGRPKGCVLEHMSVCTSQIVNSRVMRIGQETRALQFASFTFDASICEIFAPLSQGGCVCVVPDEDRLNNLANAINERRADWIMLTPSVAQLLDPADVPTIRTLVFGGEALSRQVLQSWCGHGVHLVNYWGPSECSNSGCANTSIGMNTNPLNIGRASGCHIWISDPSDPNHLVPLGCVGELLVEGPMLSRGYLNQPEQTAAAFVTNPAWARSSSKNKRRFYRTGDLARLTPDGSVVFAGRADTQVKISGQRIELGEVEYHLKRAESSFEHVVVEVLKHASRDNAQILTAFISFKGHHEKREGLLPANDETREQCFQRARERLSTVLPRYMIPSLFLPLSSMPLTSSQKLDRKKLRIFGTALSSEELLSYHMPHSVEVQEPQTNEEAKLRQLWSQLIRIPAKNIDRNDNFFKLGGDSVMAMALVAAARKQGMSLSVAGVFRHPELLGMAGELATDEAVVEGTSQVLPYSLISGRVNVTSCRADVARQCNVSYEDVEDIYLCAPLQEALMAVSAYQAGAYVQQDVWKLPNTINVNRFKSAWDCVVTANPIFRTRIAFVQGIGSLQVVLRSKSDWQFDESLQSYLRRDRGLETGYGKSLCRMAIVRAANGETAFVWTAHHAIYDGWSLSKAFDEVRHIYEGGRPSSMAPYKNFINFILQDTSSKEAMDFWRDQFPEVTISFPSLPRADYRASPTQKWSSTIALHRKKGCSKTVATVIQAAWALLSARHADASEALYGVTLSGRDIALPGIGEILGPTNTTVPLRISLDYTRSILDFLTDVQERVAQIQCFQHYGLQKIRQLGPEARSAVDFQTLMVVQPGEAAEFRVTPKQWGLQHVECLHNNFHTYPLVIEFTTFAESIRIEAQYDDAVISHGDLECLVRQFEHIIQQLKDESESKTIYNIDLVSPHDHSLLAQWSAEQVLQVNDTIHEVFRRQASTTPDRIAIEGFNVRYTYAELNAVSDTIAEHLLSLGVGPEIRVVHCFHKSKWPVIAELAILKAGGACVPTNPDHPIARLQEICKDSQTPVVLCDSELCHRFEGFASTIVVLNENLLQLLRTRSCSSQVNASPPSQKSSSSDNSFFVDDSDTLNDRALQKDSLAGRNAAYVVYTSGTTGKPKGAVLEHASLCTSLIGIGKRAQMSSLTRTLQFSAYTFDLHILEIFGPLFVGGCTCIISETERMNNLANAITKNRVNWALLMPTVARVLSPIKVPTLETLLIGGEVITKQDYREWANHLKLLNAYGPTECSILACLSLSAVQADQDPKNIGHPLNCNLWITDRLRTDYLVPIGVPGELLVEGPIVAREYFNRPKETTKAFITDPLWSRGSGCPRRFYRTGDLAKFNPDGSVTYIGRVDTQVKIRGQRLEIGEVETNVQMQMQGSRVAVELVKPSDRSLKSLLVAFITFEASQLPSDSKSMSRENANTMSEAKEMSSDAASFQLLDKASTKILVSKLRDVMPDYMVPSAYAILENLPLTAHGKLDRTKLRCLASNLTIQDLVAQSSDPDKYDTPRTEAEKRLANLWSQVLEIGTEVIGTSTSFLHVGGDSIGAMKLVAAAREYGLQLTVGDIFAHPVLAEMATVMSPLLTMRMKLSAPPFSTIGVSGVDVHLNNVIKPQITCSHSAIEDVMTVTDFQAQCVSSVVSGTRWRMLYFFSNLHMRIDPNKVMSACQKLADRHDALRTVFVTDENRSLQVVLRNPNIQIEVVKTADNAKKFAKALATEDVQTPFEYGSLWTRFWIVLADNEQALVVLRMSHAQYDGTSLPVLYKDFHDILYDKDLFEVIPFSAYINNTSKERCQEGWSYWRHVLAGSKVTQLPQQIGVPHSKVSEKETAICNVYKLMPLPCWPRSFTLSDLLSAIYGLIISEITCSQDIVLGQVMTGRNVPMEGVNRVVGACINTVPIRLQVRPSDTLTQVIQKMHDNKVAATQYDFYPFSEICQHLNETPVHDKIPWIIYHQNMPKIVPSAIETEDYMPPVGAKVEDEVSLVTEVKGDELLVLVAGRKCRESLLKMVMEKLERYLALNHVQNDVAHLRLCEGCT